MDIQVFMNFFIIHQSQGTSPTCTVLMLKIVVKTNKMFCLSFCALSLTSFHMFQEFRPISGGFIFVLENVLAAGPISLMEYQNGQYP